MTMTKGFIACLPVIVLIVLVMLSHRMTESMFIASLLASLLAYKQDFLCGYVEMIYNALSNPSYQLLLIVSCSFGGMIVLLEKSGSLFGFQRFMVRFCTTPHRTMILTWILGGIIFIDDYLNALAVSVSMKGLSDHYKIPREHLAYTINCMGACVCVLVPISSWSAFAIGSLADYGLQAADYYRAIKYMFYPFCCLIISFLLACGKFPLIGDMKKAYERVKAGGTFLPENSVTEDLKEPTQEQLATSSIWNFLIPMLCLFVGMLCFESNIIIGILLSLASMFLLYCIKGNMKITEFTDYFISGIADMAPLLLTITFGFAMQNAVEKLGFNEFVLAICSQTLSVEYIPVIAFLMVGAAAFFAASFWMLIVLTFPIFIPLTQMLGGKTALVIAAIMSGVALGSQACIFSDAVFMVASGTGVTNDDQFRTIFPYVAIGTVVAAILFLIAGFLQ